MLLVSEITKHGTRNQKGIYMDSSLWPTPDPELNSAFFAALATSLQFASGRSVGAWAFRLSSGLGSWAPQVVAWFVE